MTLAWPLVLTQVGHILTGMVDNIFLGRIGVREQAAGILSHNLYVLLLVFTVGMSYSSTPLVTEAHYRKNAEEKAGLFKNSLLLNVLVALVCFLLLYNFSWLIKYMRQPEAVVELATPYFEVLVFSLLPLSLFYTCKQYCEGLMNTTLALWISLAGNLINLALNYLLIFGKFGFPELGYMGAAWASFVARTFMGVAFMLLVFWHPLTKELRTLFPKVKVRLSSLSSLWKIGFNSAMQFTFEVAAFAIAGFMAGSLGEEDLDAHGIALSIAAFTYMFGSGIGSAATIRVGLFAAVNDWARIRLAALASLSLVILVMGAFGVLLLIFRTVLPQVFTVDPQIAAMASGLLVIAAMFQLFDGLQVTAIGILRGLKDVKASTWISLVGYWLLALPLAYFLAFIVGMKTTGIWIALLISLVFVAVCLLWRFYRLLRRNNVSLL